MVALLAFCGGAHAAFKDPLWSARVAALGGAFTAVGDDAEAAFYNPAAAVDMETQAVSFSYAKLFAGLDDVNLSLNQLAYVQPVDSFGVITAGWGSVTAGGLRREDTLILSVAHMFRNIKYVGPVSAGVGVRFLSQSYTLDERTRNDPVFQDGSTKKSWAVDAHLFSPSVGLGESALSGGISFRGINRPNVGFYEEEKLPLEVALGVLYKWRKISVPVDIVRRGADVTPQVGVEASFMENNLALRAGSDTHQIGTGLGYVYPLNSDLSLSFDYAFLWPLDLKDSSGSHRVTLGIKF